ncbi:hypothetical protein IFR05_013436 [Cadophora sp. M221]|nr:hypothetical protein IFR05_013436 [Cadophora sp. M221]
MNLAKHQDEYLAEIQQEMRDNVDVNSDGSNHFSIESLRKLSKLDSFILGKYVIPKGSICAPYVKRTHEHSENYGLDGCTFNGFQWHEQQKPAVQGNNDFISFGLGRWPCPGRCLAVAEIKLILISLFYKYDIKLKDGGFSTPDLMNTTSVSPEAIVLISRRAE